VCDLETSRIGGPYIYDISNLRVKQLWFGYNQSFSNNRGLDMRVIVYWGLWFAI